MSEQRPMPSSAVLQHLREGVVIPALPLALNSKRELDERRQRALTRYYMAAGSGGLAVAVHTTQFEIREPEHELLKPVLTIGIEEIKRYEEQTGKTIIKVAGICGNTEQAVREAEQARDLGYDIGLLSLAAMKDADDKTLTEHAAKVGEVLPLVGFYLQPSVGGRILGIDFWRGFAEIENVVAIKMAPFNRYQTIDVVRAVAEVGRELSDDKSQGIALYTGNDDNIVMDLLGTWEFKVGDKVVTQRIVGGLLGHWACWTQKAVGLLGQCHKFNGTGTMPESMNLLNRQVTDMNAAIFDPAHAFHGCIAGVHEVLRRQGLLEGIWCLNPNETLSPGQAEEITRVCEAYPHLVDDTFIAKHLDEWLK